MNKIAEIPEYIDDEIELFPGYTRDDILAFKSSIDPSNKLLWPQLKLFLQQCVEMKLDPRKKQIYAIPRWNKHTNSMELTTVVSIDGFRLIAERTGCYAPGDSTVYETDENGILSFATAFVKKMTSDGTWHQVSETAHLSEYKPKSNSMFWDKMPSVMIAKVAEGRALRRAFPADFSGVYVAEEMHQSDTIHANPAQSDTIGNAQRSLTGKTVKDPAQSCKSENYISEESYQKLAEYIKGNEDLNKKLKALCKVKDLRCINEKQLEACRKFAVLQVRKSNANNS